MGGIGLVCKQSSHIRTHMYAHTHTQTHIHISAYPCTTISCTDTKTNIYAAHRTRHRTQNTEYNNMQHIEQRTEQTENKHTSTENSAHNYRTYSLDYYQEYAYIKNSNTIELYTILHDEV